MAEDQNTEAWGVTVDQVVAVASQADVHLETDAEGNITPEPADDVFGNAPQIAKRITRAEVQTWINRVAAWVDTRLHKRRRLGKAARDRFEPAMGTAVEVGAAAYLVDAAYPQRTGVQDQASYGQVLWTRYRQALDDLEEALEGIIQEPEDDEDGTGPRHLAAGVAFPSPIFTDQWARENTGHLPPTTAGGTRAPGAEIPNRGW